MDSLNDFSLNMIFEYGSGINFLNMGTLNKETYKSWPFEKKSRVSVIDSLAIADSVTINENTDPIVIIRCMSVYASEFHIDKVFQLRDYLPNDYSVGTFNFIDKIFDIGSFFAIRFFLFQNYTESPGDYSKSIVKFVSDRKIELIELLYDFYHSKTKISNKIGNECLYKCLLVGDKQGAKIISDVFQLKGRFIFDGSLISKIATTDFNLLKWLIDTIDISEFSEKYVKYCALSGNLEALKYMHLKGSTGESSLCVLVSTLGFLDILKYLVLDMNVEMDRYSCIRYSRKHPRIAAWINSL